MGPVHASRFGGDVGPPVSGDRVGEFQMVLLGNEVEMILWLSQC